MQVQPVHDSSVAKGGESETWIEAMPKLCLCLSAFIGTIFICTSVEPSLNRFESFERSRSEAGKRLGPSNLPAVPSSVS